MKLLWSSRSPFARKVVVAAHEAGLADRITLERVVVSARMVNPAVLAHNPLGRIPTLILDDGTAIFESTLIPEYFDSLLPTPLLFPTEPANARKVRQVQAVADGLMTLNVLRLGEGTRAQASSEHLAAYEAKTNAALDWLEREAAALHPLSLASIAVACALSHLHFRFPEPPWHAGHPALAAWHAEFSRRPSMQATEHVDEY